MPLTALGGSTGTVVIGDTTTALFPQTLHPNVASFLAQLSANSFSATRAQADALNNLVWSMVGLGIWSKMKIVYPFLGGTAATHKFNLVNPQDTDAAFRLVFTGGWTHSSTGAKGNGTNAWANTYLVPNTDLTSSSGHLAYYSRTNINEGAAIEMGCQNASTTITALVCGRTLNLTSFRYGNSSTNTNATSTATTSQGLFIGSQTGTGLGDRNVYVNGLKGSAPTVLGASTLPTTATMVLNAINTNNTSRANYSAKECAYASIGEGLSETEVKNLYIIVQAYQTALGRQVT
jgi:hypothetical protein